GRLSGAAGAGGVQRLPGRTGGRRRPVSSPGGRARAGKTPPARAPGRALPAVVFCDDEWIVRLGFEIRSIEDHAAASARLRAMIGPLATELLRLGVSVVLDFSGNTVKARQWVRTGFESAGADPGLHAIDATPPHS